MSMSKSMSMSQSHTWLATKALVKASLALLNPKLWGLSLVPFLLACALWGGIAYFVWEPASGVLRGLLAQVSLPAWLFNALPSWLITVAESSRSIWIPFAVLLLVIPGVLVTVMVLVGMMGVGIVARSVGTQYGLVPLDKNVIHQGVSLLRSVWNTTWVMALLVLVWLITLPLWLVPGVSFVLPVVLVGWATARLFTFDVLAEFASPEEMFTLRRQHSRSLLVLGMLASIPAALPTLVWVGGAFGVVILPALAALAMWLYVMVFLACAALFSHYLLPALKFERERLAELASALALAQSAQAAKTQHQHQQIQRLDDAAAIDVEAREVSPTLTLSTSPAVH